MQTNQKIDHFNFFQPVVLKNDPTSYSSIALFLLKVGELADQFVYLGKRQLNVVPVQLNYDRFSFENNRESAVPLWKTALKVTLFAATLLTLPLVALLVKFIYKNYLNSIAMLKENNVNSYLSGVKVGTTRVELYAGDLLIEKTEAVVNAANDELKAGGGICGAFRSQAGAGIFQECKQILLHQKKQSIDTGEAALTSAGDLANLANAKVRTVVHAVGPIFDDRANDEPAIMEALNKQLAAAYDSSLELITDPAAHADYVSDKVDQTPMRSIGFPSISTGIYGYPLNQAAPTALKAVKAFIEAHPGALDEVRFVFRPVDQETIDAYKSALADL